jgi:hypothetical protein
VVSAVKPAPLGETEGVSVVQKLGGAPASVPTSLSTSSPSACEESMGAASDASVEAESEGAESVVG